MTRKDYLKLALVGLAACAVLAIWPGCSSYESTPPPSGGGTFVSSSVQGHTHSVTLTQSEVQTPPSGGISRATSSSQAHSHTFAITEAQLQAVNGGSTVTITDSIVQGHSHTYQIKKWF